MKNETNGKELDVLDQVKKVEKAIKAKILIEKITELKQLAREVNEIKEIAGQIAGGVLQGAVQALITKWIGAVFIEYFRNEMQTPEGGMAGLARRQWEQVTMISELRKLVTSARQKLTAKN